MSGTLEVAELDLRGRPVGVDINGERNLQKAVVLVPVHFSGNFQDLTAAGQPQRLDCPGGAEQVLDLDGGFFGAPKDHRDALRRTQVLAGVAIKRVDVPGRPFVGNVGVELEDDGRAAPGGTTSRPASRSHKETTWPSPLSLTDYHVVLDPIFIGRHHCLPNRARPATETLPADMAATPCRPCGAEFKGDRDCPVAAQ